MADEWSKAFFTRRLERAARMHESLKAHGRTEAALFVLKGIKLYNFKRDKLYLLLFGDGAYSSFDAYLADPDNEQTSTTAHLAVQVCELFMAEHRVNWRELAEVGQKKLTRLTPFIGRRFGPVLAQAAERYDANSDRLERIRARVRGWVREWVRRARDLSHADLVAEIGEVHGWTTFYSGPVTIRTLRGYGSADALLDYLGVSDLPDDTQIVVTMKGRTDAKPTGGGNGRVERETVASHGSQPEQPVKGLDLLAPDTAEPPDGAAAGRGGRVGVPKRPRPVATGAGVGAWRTVRDAPCRL